MNSSRSSHPRRCSRGKSNESVGGSAPANRMTFTKEKPCSHGSSSTRDNTSHILLPQPHQRGTSVHSLKAQATPAFNKKKDSSRHSNSNLYLSSAVYLSHPNQKQSRSLSCEQNFHWSQERQRDSFPSNTISPCNRAFDTILGTGDTSLSSDSLLGTSVSSDNTAPVPAVTNTTRVPHRGSSSTIASIRSTSPELVILPSSPPESQGKLVFLDESMREVSEPHDDDDSVKWNNGTHSSLEGIKISKSATDSTTAIFNKTSSSLPSFFTKAKSKMSVKGKAGALLSSSLNELWRASRHVTSVIVIAVLLVIRQDVQDVKGTVVTMGYRVNKLEQDLIHALDDTVTMTTTPEKKKKGFGSTEELRMAVAAYFAGEEEDPGISLAAVKADYGETIGSWDVSQIEDFSYLFHGKQGRSPLRAFNEDISEWDTSSATSMKHMFREAKAFNQDISKWDVSGVRDMSYMFWRASTFKQDLSAWQTGAVTSMAGMFDSASSFDGDIGRWDVSSVQDMRFMFHGAREFNHDISRWCVSQLKQARSMFDAAKSFNQDLDRWDTSAILDTRHMFQGATSFNGDVKSWNTASVQNMAGMFDSATAFNQDLRSWNVGRVTDMFAMFNSASSFQQDLSAWKAPCSARRNHMLTGVSAQLDTNSMSAFRHCDQ